MRRALTCLPLLSVALVVTALPLVGVAAAQDGDKPTTDAPVETPIKTNDETGATKTGTATEAADPAPQFEFAASLDDARASAKAANKPLLVVAVPDWYASPAWDRLHTAVLGDKGSVRALSGFVGVIVKESRDREVHVRHRLAVRGYPLVVVLGSEGAYLGHTSGTPAEGSEAAWASRIAEIPPRAAKIAVLRERLSAAPEDPEVLFDLGKLLADAGEADRADALFERMERAEPLGPAERMGEARYLRMRHKILGLLEAKKFGDVEPLCLHWRRRFSSHARIADVLLLQANARFLAGKADDARALWQTLVDEHADSDAGANAKNALEKLSD